MADKLIPVRFLSHYSAYNAGEVASFPMEKVRDLVDANIAEAVELDKGGKVVSVVAIRRRSTSDERVTPLSRRPVDDPHANDSENGPTLGDYVAAGYNPDSYPPEGYHAKPFTPAELDQARKRWSEGEAKRVADEAAAKADPERKAAAEAAAREAASAGLGAPSSPTGKGENTKGPAGKGQE